MGAFFRSERHGRKFVKEATSRRVPARNGPPIEIVHRSKAHPVTSRAIEALPSGEREAAGTGLVAVRSRTSGLGRSDRAGTASHRTYHVGGMCSAYTAMTYELMR